MKSTITDPDFVMVGWRDGDRFLVVMSTELDSAEVKPVMAGEDPDWFMRQGELAPDQIKHYEIHAKTSTPGGRVDSPSLVTLAVGDSYDEAFARCVEHSAPTVPMPTVLTRG